MNERQRKKVRENRLRRWASRLGLQFHKSRARRWSIDDHGSYMLVDADGDVLVAGEKFDLDLQDVEEWLAEYETRLREGGDDE
jgi:hypothetical protein